MGTAIEARVQQWEQQFKQEHNTKQLTHIQGD
jgi:hypothetical protein